MKLYRFLTPKANKKLISLIIVMLFISAFLQIAFSNTTSVILIGLLIASIFAIYFHNQSKQAKQTIIEVEIDVDVMKFFFFSANKECFIIKKEDQYSTLLSDRLTGNQILFHDKVTKKLIGKVRQSEIEEPEKWIQFLTDIK